MSLLIGIWFFAVLILVIVLWVVSDSDDSKGHVAFEVKVAVPEDGCDDESPTGNMSPSRVRRRVHRRRASGAGEVSHYAKMHSRTRYRI